MIRRTIPALVIALLALALAWSMARGQEIHADGPLTRREDGEATEHAGRSLLSGTGPTGESIALVAKRPDKAAAVNDSRERPATSQSGTDAGRAPVADTRAGDAATGVLNLDAARACWLEASWSVPDCSAILHVLMRRAHRAGKSTHELLWAYTALKSRTARAQFARQLPDGDEPSWNADTNRRWLALRRHAAAVIAGKVLDPCAARAWHWGAPDLPTDLRRATSAIKAGRWRVVRCQGRLANRFYAEVRR